MIPQQMTTRKKKYIGNACLPAPAPTEGGAGRNADAAPQKTPLYTPLKGGFFNFVKGIFSLLFLRGEREDYRMVPT